MTTPTYRSSWARRAVPASLWTMVAMLAYAFLAVLAAIERARPGA